MKLWKIVENIFITFLIFFIIWLFSILPYKLIFLDPIAKAVGDFELNDIVFSRLYPERKLDTNIVLVNIGRFNRAQIANQINIINSFQPKVIGIDAIFEKKTKIKDDFLLKQAFSQTKNLILVGILDNYDETNKYYKKYTKPNPILSDNVVYGYANLPTKFGASSKTIRTFRPYSIVNNSVVKAFSVKVIESFDKNAFLKLVKRANEIETINYRGNIDKFKTLDTEVFSEKNPNLTFLKNKIVLLGFLGNSLSEKTIEDIYFTPLNETYAGRSYPDMYGVAIHANIISMMLEGNYIDIVPAWFSSILALLVCYFNVTFIRKIRRKLTDYYGGIAKLMIFVQSIIILIVNVYLFLVIQLKMSFTLMLVGLIFIPSTVILYDNLLKHLGVLFYDKYFNRKKK